MRLISSAEETAREVAETLAARDHAREASSVRRPAYHFATTGDPAEFAALGSRIVRTRITGVEHVTLAQLEAGAQPFDASDAAAALEASCD